MFDVAVVVAVIVALGQLIKGFVPTKFMPLVSLGLGILAGFFYIPHESVQEAIFNGIAAGLSANGLFDMSKIVTKKAPTD